MSFRSYRIIARRTSLTHTVCLPSFVISRLFSGWRQRPCALPGHGEQLRARPAEAGETAPLLKRNAFKVHSKKIAPCFLTKMARRVAPPPAHPLKPRSLTVSCCVPPFLYRSPSASGRTRRSCSRTCALRTSYSAHLLIGPAQRLTSCQPRPRTRAWDAVSTRLYG